MDLSEISTWKALSCRLLMTMRGLIIAIMTWDFTLTMLSHTTESANIFLGLSTIFVFSISGAWLIAIVGLGSLLVYSLLGPPHAEETIKIPAYVLLVIAFSVYSTLAIIAILSAAVSLPMTVGYITNMVWIGALICFRKQYSRLSRL